MPVRTASPAVAGEARYSGAQQAAPEAPPPRARGRRPAPLKAAVDLGDGARDLALDLPDRQTRLRGKLGVARAVGPHGEEYLAPPARQRQQRRFDLGEKLRIARLVRWRSDWCERALQRAPGALAHVGVGFVGNQISPM